MVAAAPQRRMPATINITRLKIGGGERCIGVVPRRVVLQGVVARLFLHACLYVRRADRDIGVPAFLEQKPENLAELILERGFCAAAVPLVLLRHAKTNVALPGVDDLDAGLRRARHQ